MARVLTIFLISWLKNAISNSTFSSLGLHTMVGDSTLEIDPGTDALPLGSSEVHLAPERSHAGSAAVLKSQLD